MPRWAAILWLVAVLGIWIGLSFASSLKWGSRPVRVPLWGAAVAVLVLGVILFGDLKLR